MQRNYAGFAHLVVAIVDFLGIGASRLRGREVAGKIGSVGTDSTIRSRWHQVDGSRWSTLELSTQDSRDVRDGAGPRWRHNDAQPYQRFQPPHGVPPMSCNFERATGAIPPVRVTTVSEESA